uniref:Uncharacterized protein n=1 Tax=Mycena chlorophos TaxID=658473 RepID=A0ABQ0LR53_MYCCL|nr:predicted protein [Mycena chlorophos]
MGSNTRMTHTHRFARRGPKTKQLGRKQTRSILARTTPRTGAPSTIPAVVSRALDSPSPMATRHYRDSARSYKETCRALKSEDFVDVEDFLSLWTTAPPSLHFPREVRWSVGGGGLLEVVREDSRPARLEHPQDVVFFRTPTAPPQPSLLYSAILKAGPDEGDAAGMLCRLYTPRYHPWALLSAKGRPTDPRRCRRRTRSCVFRVLAAKSALGLVSGRAAAAPRYPLAIGLRITPRIRGFAFLTLRRPPRTTCQLAQADFAQTSSRAGILPLGSLPRSRGTTTTCIRHEHRLPQGRPSPDDANRSAPRTLLLADTGRGECGLCVGSETGDILAAQFIVSAARCPDSATTPLARQPFITLLRSLA